VTGDPLDLRAWLAEVEKLGELRHVRGADCNLELGAISELNVKKDLPPALLFDEIRGYPKGFRVLTCSTSSPARLSCILRLPIEKTHRGLVEALRGASIRPGETARRVDLLLVGTSLGGVPMLYFEVRVDGRPVDPVQWLKPR